MGYVSLPEGNLQLGLGNLQFLFADAKSADVLGGCFFFGGGGGFTDTYTPEV